jgi:hypothetical protein
VCHGERKADHRMVVCDGSTHGNACGGASCCCGAHDMLAGCDGKSLDSGDGHGQGGWSNADSSRGNGNGVP